MGPEKKILLIAYYFPPLGLGGVNRPWALYEYLPDFGFDVTVLTIKNIVYPACDFSRDIRADENSIVRTESLDPARLMYKLGLRRAALSPGARSAASWLNFPDSKRGWNLFARNEAAKIVMRKNIGIVITTSPPPSVHLIGMKLKAEYPVKWIADFRDFWFSLPIEMIYPTDLQRKYALNLKRKITASADHLVSVNNSIHDYLGGGTVITNGADPRIAERWQTAVKKDPERFIIGILGTIDDLCPIEPLFRIIRSAAEPYPEILKKVSIVHVGRIDSRRTFNLAEKYSLSAALELKGYLPRDQAVDCLAAVDLLYFSVSRFGRFDILPGRLFDYLVSGKPILAVVPPASDAETLLNEANREGAFAPDKISEAARYLEKLYQNWHRREKPPGNRTPHLEKYTTKTMAAKYADLLDDLIR